MKILLCKSHFAGPVSGSDETLVAYATHLHRQGHRLTVVLLYAPAESDQYYARLKQAGVEVITIVSYPLAHSLLRRIRSLAYWCAAFIHLPARPLRVSRNLWQRVSQGLSLIYQKHCRTYFQRCSADLIHIMTPDPGAAVMIRAGAAAGIPVLYQELGTPQHLPELEIPYRNFSKVLPLCSHLAALSPRLAKQWEDKLIPSNPISVLPLLIEDNGRVVGPERRSRAGITFGFAARLEKGKGPLILIAAFAQVRTKLSNTSLHIAGAGPQEQAVRMRAAELGVLDACELRGAYTAPREKHAFMQGLDVFILPTLAEGTPNSIIEAMANGLPVIASAVGGVPDLITRDSGILVPPEDPTALANAMLRLASDRELRIRMGRAARARYEELFSPAVIVPMLIDTYRRAATKSSNGNGNHTQASSHPWIETAASASRRASLLKGCRIIFVLGNLELGGAERQALILARHLAANEQATVEVWGFNTTGPVAKICDQHGIPWRVVAYPFTAGPLKRLTSLLQLARLLRKARADVLLPYTSVPNVACGLIWKWTGARVCVWNQRDEGIVSLDGIWDRWAIKRTPYFLSNSNAGAQLLIDKLNVSSAKVRVVQNGIEEFTPKMDRHAWRERLEIDEAAFVACMVANLHSNKDHRTLLQAWREVVTAIESGGREAVLVLAGRHDSEFESLAALAYELKIERSIRFAGHVSDIPGLLSAVDLGVFSSRSEGCPNGVLECMAAGLAVAATNIDGIREVVGSAGEKFLAPSGDAEALARVMLELASDPGLRSSLGAENRKRIRENYQSQQTCEETVDLLEDLYTQARKYCAS
jgi:glycosyltransferase involved in cell wall biosynthesis